VLLAHSVIHDVALSVEARARMHGGLLTSGAELSDGLVDGAHVNVGNLNALVVVNLESLVDYTRGALDSDAFGGTFVGLVSETHDALLVDLRERVFFDLVLVLEAEELSVFARHGSLLVLVLIEFNGGKELSFGEKAVDLFNEL
jgi:hypothetical protein